MPDRVLLAPCFTQSRGRRRKAQVVVAKREVIQQRFGRIDAEFVKQRRALRPDAAEIANFCSLTYDVSFPMMAKVDVNGPATHPLYAYLKHARKGLLGSEAIKWNFTKFLIDRQGEPVKLFAPLDKPESLSAAVESVL